SAAISLRRLPRTGPPASLSGSTQSADDPAAGVGAAHRRSALRPQTMTRLPRRIFGWARRRAENALAALLVAMFVAFLIQIVMRYVLNAPVGWTTEVSTLAWLWGILWGAALVLKDEEE